MSSLFDGSLSGRIVHSSLSLSTRLSLYSSRHLLIWPIYNWESVLGHVWYWQVCQVYTTTLSSLYSLELVVRSPPYKYLLFIGHQSDLQLEESVLIPAVKGYVQINISKRYSTGLNFIVLTKAERYFLQNCKSYDPHMSIRSLNGGIIS